jgi:cytochrome d ubiquinol oxidase subunit II
VSDALVVAGGMLIALVLYLLLGGADFGGGVWDLLASGPRRRAQRALIERAIGPIWEANHVWLILVVVLLFSAFPRAFAAISISLHVPLSIFLIGVVLRGSAFTFRSYDADDHQRRWGLVFSLASVLSPVLLGVTVGALCSGRIRVVEGAVEGGFFAPWLAPFPLSTGAFALVLCAFLAATYLTCEAEDPQLREDFRARALGAGVALGGLALVVFLLAGAGAPRIREGLSSGTFALPLHAATALAAPGALGALVMRRFTAARALAQAQTALIVLGWAASQAPFLVVPDLTIENAAANPRTLRLLLWALAAGVPVLAPSLWLLYKVFKARRTS